MSFEDKLYKHLKIYNSAPTFVRNSIGKIYRSIPLSIRYGKTYKYYNKLLKISPYFTTEEKRMYTIDRLKLSLINAYENTIYYKNLFKEIKFDPYKFNNIDQMKSIPFSEKNILRQYKDQLINAQIPESKLLYTTTGGTSGVPVEVFFTKGKERSREIAFMNNQWNRINYKNGDKIVRIRGTVVDKNKNIFHKFEPIKNRLLLSTFDMYEDNYKKYINLIVDFNPKYIHTYPSAILPLAKYILKNKINITGLQGILCSSEQFYPGQRKLIEEAFNTRVFSWYGHTENATLAGECEQSKNYHTYFEYGYTELIDEDNNIINQPGKQGEIVGTSFEMFGFPIIRYRTGDLAEFVEGPCSCGRNYTLIRNIKGRWVQEQIISYKGHGISLTALNMHSNIFDNVLQYQFYQNTKGKVELRIIKSKYYTLEDEKKIKSEFNLKFRDMVDLNISYVNKIIPTKSGKHKFLIQEIKRGN